MTKSLKHMTIAGVFAAGSALAATPALAQIDLGVGTDVDVGVGVDVGTDAPRDRHPHYVYHGYESGHWYTEHEVRRTERWYPRYSGYDCYESFQYTWDDGQRIRYETTFCYDERGRKFEADDARVTIRID